MAYRLAVRSRAIELLDEGYSGEKVADILQNEFVNERIPVARTIQRWRHEAKEASEINILQPFSIEQQKIHFEKLMEIARFITPERFELSSGALEGPDELSPRELYVLLDDGIESAYMKFGDQYVEEMKKHIELELPDVASMGFDRYLDANPYKAYKAMWRFSRQGTSKLLI